MLERFRPGSLSISVATGFLVAACVTLSPGGKTTGGFGGATLGAQGSTLPLINSQNMTYEGAFKIPNGIPNDAAHGAAYGGGCLSYNPAGNGGAGSLFVCGLDVAKLVGEIGIPTPVISSQMNSLPTAPLVSNFADVLQGHAGDIYGPGGNTSVAIGGVLAYNGRLIVSVYSVFDTDAWNHPTSHFVASTDFANPQLIGGPYQLGNPAMPGFVAGYMTPIPAAFQAALGGPFLAGQCCLNIIGRTSSGPSATVFNPDDIGRVTPAPAKRVLGYPLANPTLGDWQGLNSQVNPRLYDGAARLADAVFPENSRSVLFIGRVGTGAFCYGEMTNDPALHLVEITPGLHYCYDPSQSGKGSSSYPYKFLVAAYDANDLVAVKNGTKQEYQVLPYTTWEINLPIMYPNGIGAHYSIGGVAYDPSTQRIFVSQRRVDSGDSTIINVFKIDLAALPGLCR